MSVWQLYADFVGFCLISVAIRSRRCKRYLAAFAPTAAGWVVCYVCVCVSVRVCVDGKDHVEITTWVVCVCCICWEPKYFSANYVFVS